MVDYCDSRDILARAKVMTSTGLHKNVHRLVFNAPRGVDPTILQYCHFKIIPLDVRGDKNFDLTLARFERLVINY